jgi:molybdopterin-guanine dinucleotide biosynthesis protein A
VKITGIILAGGMSKRMGTEKGLIPFLGKPMIEHVLEAIKPLCNHIIISSNNQAFTYLGFPVIKDSIMDFGPSAGIFEGLKKASSSVNIIVPCDMPFVSTSFLRCLITFSKDYEITVTEVNNVVQPLCGIYNKSILPQLKSLMETGEKTMTNLLNHFQTNYVNESEFPEHDLETLFQNFNSPEEIKNYLSNNK